MPRRDVLVVLGCWLGLAFWARDAYTRVVVENPLTAVATNFVVTDSTLARTLGGTPVVDRLISVRGTPGQPRLVFALGAPHRDTDVEIVLRQEEGAWQAREFAVFSPDTVFLIAEADPELPPGPLLAPARQPVDSVRFYIGQGAGETHRGNHAAALAAYERAYQLDASDYDAVFWYATELARAGRHHDAQPLLEGLIRRQPDRGDAYYTRGIMRLRLGQPDELIADDLRASCRRDYELACQTLDRNGLPR